MKQLRRINSIWLQGANLFIFKLCYFSWGLLLCTIIHKPPSTFLTLMDKIMSWYVQINIVGPVKCCPSFRFWTLLLPVTCFWPVSSSLHLIWCWNGRSPLLHLPDWFMDSCFIITLESMSKMNPGSMSRPVKLSGGITKLDTDRRRTNGPVFTSIKTSGIIRAQSKKSQSLF